METEGFKLREGFRGNPKLRPAGLIIPYTEDQVKEILKCRKDIVYFAENYYKIITLDKGLQTIKLYDFQKDLLRTIQNEKRIIVLASRQVGKTTTYAIFCLWYILFYPEKSIAITANKERTAIEILDRIKTAYQELPIWLQQGIIGWGRREIMLENNSKILAASTSSTAIRGFSMNVLIIDEMAFIPRNIFNDFWSSVYPVISSGQDSKVIIVSTPNKKNHFYKFWIDAKEGRNLFKPVFVHWSQVPGRDEKWVEETKRSVGELTWMQEFECKFIGAADTLIEPTVLEQLRFKYPIKDSIIHEKLGSNSEFLYLYEEVKPGHTYVIGVDSSKIKQGESTGDGTSIQVLDVTEIPFKQVAHFYVEPPAKFHYLDIIPVTYQLAKYFNNALVFIENNDIGQEIADGLAFDYEYENVYFQKPDLPGFRQTTKTRHIGLMNLKTLIEKHQLIINDWVTIEQLSSFVKKGKKFQAAPGNYDDAVMALTHALFFLQVPGFEWIVTKKELIEQKKISDEIEKFKQKMRKELEDQYEDLPLPVLNDENTEQIIDGYLIQEVKILNNF